MNSEVARLQKVLAQEQSKLKDLKTKNEALVRETEQLAKVRDDTLAKRMDSNSALAELTRTLSETTVKETELLKQQAALQADYEKLRREKEEHDKQEAALIGQLSADPENMKRLRVQALKQEIALERSQRELAELELEELTLEVEDAKLEVADLADMPANCEISEAQQVDWHKKALWSFFEEHHSSMQHLRRRQVVLEKAQKHSKETKNGRQQAHDVEELQRTVEQLTQRFEWLTKENAIMEQAMEERLGLRQDDLDMWEAQKDLEDALSEELNWKRSRAHQLEALATQLYQGQQELHTRLGHKKGMVARLEVRLQTLQSQAKAQAKLDQAKEAKGDTGEKSSQAVAEPVEDEMTTAAQAAKVRTSGIMAEAIAACLPPAVREEAELGRSFHSLCGLHRILFKAQTFSQFVHENYIEDSVLSVLQAEVPVAALCSACLLSEQLAYAAAGVLGRLHAAEAERYKELIHQPAIIACGDGESAVDSAAGAVLVMLQQSMSGESNAKGGQTRGMREALAALNALVAQLFSVQTALFKDVPYVSWQQACYVSQAVRAACAKTLYASEDAGGTRRKKWRELYSKAHRIAKRLAPHMKLDFESKAVVASAAAGQGPGLLVVEPSEPPPTTQRKSTAASEGGAEAVAEATLSTTSEGGIIRDPVALAEEGHLVQELLDGLSRQASVLSSFADAEPQDERAAVKLDKAFASADEHFDVMITLIKKRSSKPKEKVPSPNALPQPRSWNTARQLVIERVQVAEKEGPAEWAAAHGDLDESQSQLKAAEAELEKEKKAVAELEQKYSASRVEAEQYTLAESQVERLTIQLKAGAVRKKDMEEELKKEASLVEAREAAMAKTRGECRNLNLQIAEAEQRLQRRYNPQIAVEDVAALRRTCVHQQNEIMFLRRRKAKKSCKELLAEEEKKASAAAADLKRAMRSRSAISMAADGLDDEEATLEDCWLDIKETRRGLLLEQARSMLLDLQDSKPSLAVKDHESKLTALARKTSDIRNNITQLLHEAANQGNNSGKACSSQFASVALVRFLKETHAAVDRGPMAKLAVTAPKSFGGSRSMPAPAVPVLADRDQLMSIHHALI